jgi:hypothetical protein
MAYYEKLKLKEILKFEDFCGRIVTLAMDNNVYIQYKFDE